MKQKNEEKALNLLGMAMRAGKLITGESLSIKEIQKENAKLVIVAKDASKKTKDKMVDKCTYYQIPIIICFTTATLSHAIGKDRMICTVLDQGFTKKLKELLAR